MNAPYSPRTPKKLERSRSNKMLGGVCGGFAEYVNMDPTLVRVLTVILTLFTGVPVLVYIVALFIVPEQPAAPTGYQSVQNPNGYQAGSANRDDAVWGTEGAPWEQPTAAQPATRGDSEPQDPKPGL